MDIERKPFETWAIVEEWRAVVGFEELYEVSSFGRVRRVGKAARNGKGHGGGVQIGRVMNPVIRFGYANVQLWKDGKPLNALVHRLVAAAFLGPVPARHEVNHISGSKANNAAANLEYVTRSENMAHAYRLGLRTPTPPRGPRRKIPV